MSIDLNKVEQCKTDILKAYARDNQISKIVDLHTVPETDGQFRKIGLRTRVNKEWFIDPSTIPIFNELGSAVARGELEYLVKNAIKLASVRAQIHRDDIAPGRIKQMFDPVLTDSARFTLLVPIWIKYDLMLKESRWQSSYDRDLNSFVIDLGFPVPIMSVHEDYIDNNVAAVNRNFATWKIKTFGETNTNIFVSITEPRDDSTKVDIGAWSLVKLDDVDPNLLSALSVEIPT